ETGDTVVYRWYLRDEPSYIDLFEPSRYIDSLLREMSTERVGFQAFNKYWVDTLEHEYLLRQDPQEYHVDIYPTCWWGPDSSGGDFQQGVSGLTQYLNESKQEAKNREKDLWVTIQAHYFGWKIPPDSCPSGWSLYFENIPYPGWYCYYLKRPPTPNELRFQSFLALCYGADAILNYVYGSHNNYDPGRERIKLELGLYEHMGDSTTARWREIKDFTGPRVEALGPVFNQLTWQGACSDDDVGSFVLRNGDPSYIDSIIGQNPDSTYVEVGFFEGYEANHFMLVNRRCLETEHEFLKVYFNLPDGPYYVTDMFTPEFPDGKICGVNPYTVALEPGEGRFFKLEKIIYEPGYVLHVPQQYSTIQSAIDASWDWATTILVETGTYYENIDFKGKNCTVASYLHLYPNSPEYITNTIIDGSSPNHPDSGSVVRFVSGETSCATLKGFTIRNGSGTLYPYREEPGKYGGGIYCKGSSPTITNNIIIENSVTGSGGGIVCQNASPQILNNLIKENVANIDGGGIAILPYFQEYATPIVSNNVIVDNLAGNRGGGIYYHASPFITNNTIDGDSAGVGGGIYVSSDYHGWIENNIITNSLGGGGISAYQGPEVMAYNDVWNNADGDFDIWVPEGVGDTSWGVNRNGTPCDSFYNIIGDPYFCDGYHLADSSACVNAGDNQAPYMLPVDFDGNPRVVDYADMGAYEYQSGSRGGGGAKIAGSDTTAESKPATGAPKAFELSQNYPNPFNPVTSIRFIVGSGPTHTTLKIYNLCGQLVRTLVNEEKAPGTYSVTWDGKNNSGKDVASGIYFYQLKSKNFKDTKQMVLIR
ncbi:MAG: FlgD immunoglobulin-like domain containing protein, partial [Candidatus Zixiibacteriota bacterium]